jgi:predicted phage terminase large subunit-like protein
MLTAQVIQGFVGSLLAKKFDGATTSPDCHLEWWELCCSKARYVALAAPRGHAKSTAITLCYGLAALLFRERKFMLMVSDTEAQAAMFLGSIKAELQENEELIQLFGIKRNDKGDVEFIKDSETDIIVQFTDGSMFRVIAKGAEQKLRGLNWNGTRPDLIIADDMENDEAVMNKDRREKMRRWFYSALLPALSPHGIVRMVGTILHMDSLLERLMPENQFMNQRAKRENLLVEPLKTHTNYQLPWKSARYRAHTNDFAHILWKSRFNEQFFREKYADYLAQGLPDAYSQEYLNVPIDESVAYFKRSDFIPMTDEDRKKPLNYYITVDLAISDKERADYSVFLVAGVDEGKRLHIKNVIRDRLDGREIVDLILHLERTYHPVAMGIEEMQVSKAIGPFLYEEMIKTNTYPSIVPMKHLGQDKLTRARSIQARTRAGGIIFDKEGDWYPAFEDECARFPRDKNDDQVDAFAYLGLLLDKLVEAPTDQEIAEQEYEDEFNESGLSYSGRNATTGY